MINAKGLFSFPHIYVCDKTTFFFLTSFLVLASMCLFKQYKLCESKEHNKLNVIIRNIFIQPKIKNAS